MWVNRFLENFISIGITNELMIFAFFVMIPMELYLAKRFSVSPLKFFFASLPSVYFSYVLSHVFHIFLDATPTYIKFLTRPDYSLFKAFFNFYGTATMFYGSLIGCLFGMALCYPLFWKQKKAYLRCFDVTIICFAFTSIFARIADIYTGESYGFIFDSPFSMVYGPGSKAARDFVTRGLLEEGMVTPPLFPTQPIMVIAKVVILLVLLIKCFTDKKKVPLSYLALYFAMYGPYRFCIDFFRFDRASYFLGLTVSQWISVILTLLAVLYYIFLYKKLTNENRSFRFGKVNFKKAALFTLVLLVFLSVFAWKGLTHYDDGKSETAGEDNGVSGSKSGEGFEIIWSKISYTRPWEKAKEYCENLDEDGFSDWRLPDIDELRTLVHNHSGTQSGGTCRISEKAGKLSSRDRTFRDCNGRKGSDFSDLPKKEKFWSSSVLSDFPYDRWYVDLNNGGVYTHDTIIENYVICVRNASDDVYDAVVVGGGLAGLSAAYNLKNKLGEEAKILLLEKEDRLGGRILTKKFGEYFYELGATFGYSPTIVPQSLELPELLVSPDLYGEYKNGGMTFSKNVSIRDTSLSHYSNIIGNGEHYGKYEYLSHRVGGNGTMIEAYEKELAGKFLLEAEVVSVQNEGKNIVVSYKKDGKNTVVKAKTVIVATTATAAAKILKNMNEESENFLKSMSYHSYAVVNIIAQLEKQPEFASAYSENLTLYVTNNSGNVSSLYCYIHGKTERESVDFARQRLSDMEILNEKSQILHIDSRFWPEEGTVISEEAYKNFSETALNPLPGVFLAGDYTYWNKLKLPYGMPPAYLSGRSAAEKAAEYLRKPE